MKNRYFNKLEIEGLKSIYGLTNISFKFSRNKIVLVKGQSETFKSFLSSEHGELGIVITADKDYFTLNHAGYKMITIEKINN